MFQNTCDVRNFEIPNSTIQGSERAGAVQFSQFSDRRRRFRDPIDSVGPKFVAGNSPR